MRYFHTILIVFLLAVTVASQAQAIEIEKVTRDRIKSFQHASSAQASAYLSGYTLAVKLGRVPARLRKLLAISTVSILYFAPNGKLLGWSEKSEIVEAGKWRVKSQGNGNNNVCLYFPKGEGDGICTILSIGHPMFVESTKGNPFRLKAGKPVPYHLERFGMSLSKSAKKLGL